MSYDIFLMIDTGGDELHDIGFHWNYTSNSSGAWRDAGADLAMFDGKLASECEPSLAYAVENMRGNPARYKAFDAPIGWGTYETLLPALERLLDAFRCHPKTTVRVAR